MASEEELARLVAAEITHDLPDVSDYKALTMGRSVVDALDTEQGRAVVARALRLYYPDPQTLVTVYGYDFDRDAADALFDRVMAAAHELDEEVTCVGGPILAGRESVVERTGDEGEH